MNKVLFAAAALVAALAVAYLAFVSNVETPLSLPDGGLVIEVPPGTGLSALASRLHQENVLESNPLALRLWARLTADEGVIKAGEYQLSPGLTGTGLVSLLRAGRVLERSITFVEGWTFRQWRDHLASVAHLESTVAHLTNDQIMARLGQPGVPAEGQFFPDTYRYVRGESDLSILSRARERMQQTLDAEWSRRDPSSLLETPQDALILASIVEKESGYDPDRPKIARVFMNRLATNMRLQSDPTVIYGIEDFDGDLTRTHLREPSSHNTYVIRGLPPTPICNPGLYSIRAALNPAPGPWQYFVGRGDGRSEFSVTLEEHNAAVVRYQKAGRVKNYRSAPPAAGSGSQQPAQEENRQ